MWNTLRHSCQKDWIGPVSGRRTNKCPKIVPLLRDCTQSLYSTRDEMRCFRSQSSNPKRQRGRALPPSLTLRVTFTITRVQYKWPPAT
jgi:hypothetical protein